MLRFHTNVYALPEDVSEGKTLPLRGIELATLSGPAGGPPAFLRTLPVSFETMQASLSESARCDCEPDGFFLLTGEHEGQPWRLSGHMFEHEQAMHRVKLHGECPAESLDSVLRTMGWPDTQLAFELVQEGVTLREADFRVWASCGSAAVGDDAAHGETSYQDDFTVSHAVPAVAPTEVTPTPPNYTPWHITFGTYGTRLHGDARPTVDREHNQYEMPFVTQDDGRKALNEMRLLGQPVRLSIAQRKLIEQATPEVCERGGWLLRAVAAQEHHVHVVCDIPSDVHGERVRRLLKRWLTEALNEQWPDAQHPRWWAVQGSNMAIHDEDYLRNAIAYVEQQRTGE